MGARGVGRAHGQPGEHGVGVPAVGDVEAEHGAVGRRVAEGEPHLGAAARRERRRLDGRVAQRDAGGARADAHRRGAARPLVHDDAGDEVVVVAEEARQRRPRQQGPRHQQRRLSAPVAVAGRHGDRHDAEGGEVVGELGGGHGVAVGVGAHRAEEERGGGEPRAQHVARLDPAASAGRLVALDGDALGIQHLRRHRDEVARQVHPHAARLVEQGHRVGRPVAGQGEHPFVHGPQRHLAAHAGAGGVAHVEPHARRVAGAVFGRDGLDAHVEALDARRHDELRVPDAQGRPPRIADAAGPRAAPPHDHDRDVGVGDVRFGERELQRRGAGREAEPPLLDDALALDRDPRFRVGEGRREEDRGRVADVVARPVGNDVHLELRLVAPGHPPPARGPAVEAGRGRAPGGVPGLEADHVRAAQRRREAARDGVGGRHEVAARHRVRDPLAHLLVEPLALAHHAMPLAADDRSVHRHARHPLPVRPDGEDRDLDRLARGPEVLVAQRLRGDVQGRRVDRRGRGGGDRLPVHVADRGRNAEARRAPLGGRARAPRAASGDRSRRAYRCRSRPPARPPAPPPRPPTTIPIRRGTIRRCGGCRAPRRAPGPAAPASSPPPGPSGRRTGSGPRRWRRANRLRSGGPCRRPRSPGTRAAGTPRCGTRCSPARSRRRRASARRRPGRCPGGDRSRGAAPAPPCRTRRPPRWCPGSCRPRGRGRPSGASRRGRARGGRRARRCGRWPWRARPRPAGRSRAR